MSDFHRNIFSYFRGASQVELDRQKQLEDNTTKALVNTLEHSDPDVVQEFLEWLEIPRPREIRFAQQKTSLGEARIQGKPKRLLLAIVGTRNEANEEICKSLPQDSIGASRPDAWIYGEEFVVLVESKTGDSKLEQNQMACHWNKLRPNDWKVITWADVHRFFKKISGRDRPPKTEWIVKQFTEYLEWTGMTEFTGFREEMFEFFIPSNRDSDTQQCVRGAVEGLADKVLLSQGGLRDFNSWYSDKHVGNFTKDADHFWVAFGPADTFRNSAHQTISLYEQKLDVFVNVELLPAIKRLRQKIASGAFRNVVSNLPAPFTVHIEERRKTTRPRIFDNIVIADIEGGMYENCPYGLKDPSSPGFEYLEHLLMNVQYPYFSVRKSINRRQLLELSTSNGDALVDEILTTLKGFHPLVAFINE